MGNPYPEHRKRKLSDPRDAEFFSQSFKKFDGKGVNRRYLTGKCELCGENATLLWGSFTRIGYKFLHLVCTQRQWNDAQVEVAHMVPTEELAYKVYKKYRHGTVMRGYEFTITFEQFFAKLFLACAICGDPPSKTFRKTRAGLQDIKYNGIDRIDNEIGYTDENCAPCCTRCNFIKKDTGLADWNDFLDKVGKKWQNKSA